MESLLRSRGESGSVPEPRRFYSVAEVAAMVGTCEATIRRAIYAGEFPAVKIRGRYIVPAKALDEMVDAAMTSQAMVDPADWVAAGGVA